MSQDIWNKLRQVIAAYDVPGALVDYKQCVNGHINETYQVFLADNGAHDRFVLQKINHYVFKDPVLVMRNIAEIARHLQGKERADECDIITFLANKEGKNYTVVDGEYWRLCEYVEDSVSFDFAEDSQVLYSAGYAFGRFCALLADLPMERLSETIPNFHNTKMRLEAFFAAVEEDPLGRAKDVAAEIAFFAEQRELASTLTEMLERGEIPLRVVHNDTKYNNILMHKDTLEPLCVIDLDTVMPGLIMHDFGDAIRFAANTALEDEPDLSKVALNMENYRQFTKGFMSACGSFITPREIENMALGAVTITIELASRFLADHLLGDKYFRIHREGHNLDRARCQIKLAQDMLAHYDEMCAIVKESCQQAW